ncbi:hypothetical protein CTRI78_v002388 [Colletotrichum trifolii]|uniref:Uncharacterized protein n=1 Tax=Colletotrichum trifolii TaxID=5466 RepID=A0A4R8RXI8_COLTR|nr:hypothetical protein CTRI78_v002388 [Colletotrichum trifolii]
MCSESIALCESCGFYRHIHYQRCMAWIWSFRQIEWAFQTPVSAIPKPSDCPHLDGEVTQDIPPGRCPNKECSGHARKAEDDAKKEAEGTADTRTDDEKIEHERIRLGFAKLRSRTFIDPLEVGRPHQRKMPVVMVGFSPQNGSGWGRVQNSTSGKASPSTLSVKSQVESVDSVESAKVGEGEKEGEQECVGRGQPIPIPLPANPPARRKRTFNGPMMAPH